LARVTVVPDAIAEVVPVFETITADGVFFIYGFAINVLGTPG